LTGVRRTLVHVIEELEDDLVGDEQPQKT
jgi:hypothetical protein